MLDRRGITWLDIAALLLGGGMLLSLLQGVAAPMPGTAPSIAPGLDTDLRGTTIDQMDPIPSDAAGKFTDWVAEAGYYGAFAVGTDGATGWMWGANSEAMARAAALAHCGLEDAQCRVVAVARPETPPPPGSDTLGTVAQGYFADYAVRPGAGAFATSPSGASGWSWNHSTRASAQHEALEHCRGFEQMNWDAHLPKNTCRIVHVHGLF